MAVDLVLFLEGKELPDVVSSPQFVAILVALLL